MFNKKKAIKPVVAPIRNLQEVHQEFTNTLLQLGDFVHQRVQMEAADIKLAEGIEELHTRLKALGVEAQQSKEAAQKEVEKKAAEGAAKEANVTPNS